MKDAAAVQEAALQPTQLGAMGQGSQQCWKPQSDPMRPCPMEVPVPSTVIPLKPAAVVPGQEPGAVPTAAAELVIWLNFPSGPCHWGTLG